MAPGVSSADRAAPGAVPSPPPGAPRERLHHGRFTLLYIGLSAAIGAAIAGVVLLVGSSGGSSGAGGDRVVWSSWQPTGGIQHRLDEITSRVAPRYRLPSGKQLVAVVAKPLAVPQPDGTEVRVNGIVAKDPITDTVTFSQLQGNSGIELLFCGGGPNCSIPEGTPTVARGRLVRREALELALYAFKYVDGVDHVVAFMPPRKGATTNAPAVYWRRDDLARQLERPLSTTLGLDRELRTNIAPSEISTIDSLTLPRVFVWALQPAPPDNAELVLQPPSA